jgi:hypothetical protein
MLKRLKDAGVCRAVLHREHHPMNFSHEGTHGTHTPTHTHTQSLTHTHTHTHRHMVAISPHIYDKAHWHRRGHDKKVTQSTTLMWYFHFFMCSIRPACTPSLATLCIALLLSVLSSKQAKNTHTVFGYTTVKVCLGCSIHLSP